MTSIVDLVKSQHNRPHQFVRYLSKKHRITVVSINDWWKGRQHNFKEYSREWEDILKKIEIIYITHKKTSPILQETLYSYPAVRRLLKDNSFDVHLNYNSITLGYFATKALLKRGVPTIFDLADDLIGMIRESVQIPGPLRPLGAKIGEFVVGKNIKLSRKITVTNQYLMERYNIPRSKTVLLPNGVDVELFKNYKSAKSQFELEDYFVIGYVGVLREWVDLEPIYRALKELPDDVIFLVVGKEGRYRENISLARRYGIADKVKFVGNVPYSRVPLYVSAMDVGVIPFKLGPITEHALPLKLFEYMACEIPVISTPLPAVKTAVGDRILYANNSREWRDKVLSLYNDESLRKTLGKKGRTFVVKNYDWKQIVQKLDQTLEEVVN